MDEMKNIVFPQQKVIAVNKTHTVKVAQDS